MEYTTLTGVCIATNIALVTVYYKMITSSPGDGIAILVHANVLFCLLLLGCLHSSYQGP